MKTFPANSSQRGFTLIELMIAMLMGVFLTGGILQIFASSKQAYRLQENLSRLQENGRFAMDFITKDVRMVGFAGCLSSKVTPTIGATPKNPNPNPSIPTAFSAISGQDNVSSTDWNASACGNECVKTTDVITFQSASSCGAPVTGNTTPDNANLKVPANNTCDIDKYDVLLVADCNNADVFVIENKPSEPKSPDSTKSQTITHPASQNLTPKLNHKYGNDAEVFKFQFSTYFIRMGAGGLPSLYRLDNAKKASNGTNPVELIEGIENMQIVYGVDTDLTADYIPNYYVDASKITGLTIPTKDSTGATVNADAWTRVVSVRITLLAATIDNGLTFSTKTDGTQTSQPYTYNGTKFTPPDTDRRIRREFSSTIAVRNRLP